ATIAAHLMNPPADPGQIAGEVSATGDSVTNFLTISAQDPNPARAGQIANAFARAISFNRQQAAIAQLNSAIVGINSQLSHTSLNDRSQRLTLQQQLSQLKAARATQGSDAAILQSAGPGSPVGLNTRRTIELGLVIGLLLGLGGVVLAENADRRLRTPGDLEGMTDLPLLASVAPSAFSGQLETTELDDEAFHMLRTALTYYHVDRPLESLVITSPGEKDGKTTVATRLAIVMARAGQNVILVDGDLRRAQVSAKLGIKVDAGLESVLAGAKALQEALVEYPLAGLSRGHLTVLPAGPPPPDPSALISSEKMQRVLRELTEQSDIVIIDTPAALAVSDPLALMRSVSGVVLVARMNTSTRETIRRLQRMISSAHGTLLGVVATGAAAGPVYDGYSPKHYGTKSGNDSKRRLGRSKASDAKPVSAANEAHD
ncbi:MAG TPA: polysaccharide biosynthesis tyrosine autokinase, partial [Solirubrobacteraceae bacterium]